MWGFNLRNLPLATSTGTAFEHSHMHITSVQHANGTVQCFR